MAFKSNKNAKELGINLRKKFIITKKLKGDNKGFTSDCSIGDILKIKLDDGTHCPFFWNLTKYPNKEDYVVCYWRCLDYYNETKKQYKYIKLIHLGEDYAKYKVGKKILEVTDLDAIKIINTLINKINK